MGGRSEGFEIYYIESVLNFVTIKQILLLLVSEKRWDFIDVQHV